MHFDTITINVIMVHAKRILGMRLYWGVYYREKREEGKEHIASLHLTIYPMLHMILKRYKAYRYMYGRYVWDICGYIHNYPGSGGSRNLERGFKK